MADDLDKRLVELSAEADDYKKLMECPGWHRIVKYLDRQNQEAKSRVTLMVAEGRAEEARPQAATVVAGLQLMTLPDKLISDCVAEGREISTRIAQQQGRRARNAG